MFPCFRPYHAMLLLVEENALLESLPIDSSPALTRVIKVASPVKSLQNLSSDADLPLGQVCNCSSMAAKKKKNHTV